MGLRDFRPTCPRCGDRLRSNARRCESCGTLSGLIPVRVIRRVTQPVAPRPDETTDGRYIVREVEGLRINMPIREGATRSKPGIECVVLDTLWNHRVTASFTSESFVGFGSRSLMFELARAAAATRCDLLNRLDEIATRKREDASPLSETAA